MSDTVTAYRNGQTRVFTKLAWDALGKTKQGWVETSVTEPDENVTIIEKKNKVLTQQPQPQKEDAQSVEADVDIPEIKEDAPVMETETPAVFSDEKKPLPEKKTNSGKKGKTSKK